MRSSEWFRERLGARLRHLREEQALRVLDVAALAGIHQAHIYNVERGVGIPSLDMLISLSMVYKVDVTDLFVFPDLHPRHAVRELVRLTPNARLGEAHDALEKVAMSPAAPQLRRKAK